MQFKSNIAFSLAALFACLSAAPTMADHNSIWEEGFAPMPYDVHNARIEGTDSEDNIIEDWSDYVSGGTATDTVNRYLDPEEVTSLPSATTTNSGVDRAAQVTRGGRPDVSSTVGMRAMNVSIDRPASISRGGRR